MNKTLNNVIMIAIGAAIGSVATWKLMKDKYEEIANKEIQSMREYYRQKEEGEAVLEGVRDGLESINNDIRKAAEELAEEKKAYTEYARRYTSEQLVRPETKLEEEEEDESMTRPYIITPEEFADGDYTTETLTYYADGVIEDDFQHVWDEDDVELRLVEDFADHYGEYEDDTVYVRNDNEGIDYEILRDERKYTEVYRQEGR